MARAGREKTDRRLSQDESSLCWYKNNSWTSRVRFSESRLPITLHQRSARGCHISLMSEAVPMLVIVCIQNLRQQEANAIASHQIPQRHQGRCPFSLHGTTRVTDERSHAAGRLTGR